MPVDDSIPNAIRRTTHLALDALAAENLTAALEATDMAVDPDHVPAPRTAELLAKYRLTDGTGKLHNTVRVVVREWAGL